MRYSGYTSAVKITLLALVLLSAVTTAGAEEVENVTGLPAYPNFSYARMDAVARTDKMGHWCNRFSGYAFDPLEVVESWYRKALLNASETDLKNDERYRNLDLSGIKLAVGIDYITVYRITNQSSTIIELFRCSPPN